MAPINVTTSKQQITASVAEDKVTANVSAGFGATGPQGPSGIIAVTAPITNSGTTTAANVGLSVGTGLAVSGGSLVLGTHTHDDRYYTETEVNNLLAGYATLVGGKVPAAQLPSYVDDVVEVATFGQLPSTGETGKIYVVLQTNKVYRWTGFVWLEIVASPGTTDALAEGNVNLYHTTARAAAAAPVQSVAGRTGAVVLGASDIVSGTLSASRLPIASAGSLGGVRIGSGISIDGSGVISVSSASVAWNDISGKPTFATVATSGSYADLTNVPSTFAPSAHAASHAEGGGDEVVGLLSRWRGQWDEATHNAGGYSKNDIVVVADVGSEGLYVCDSAQSSSVQIPGDSGFPQISSSTLVVSVAGKSGVVSLVAADVGAAEASHAHGSITSVGAIGTASGLIVTTGVDGVLGTLAQGTAGQVLKVNSGATGVEWVTLGSAASASTSDFAAASHTHAQLHDRSHAIASSSDHTATAWRLFYSNGSGVITELTLGSSGQALLSNGASAAPSWGSAGSNSASDLTTGTLANARMTTRARASMNLYLWSSFR